LRKQPVGRLFPFSHFISHRIDRRSDHPTAKMMRETIRNVSCRIIVISRPATSLSRSSVERSVRIRRPAQVVTAATTAGGRDCRSPYFSSSNAISDVTWNNQRASIARSSGLNLVQRRLFKIAREPSANANLEGAQPEPAGQMGAAEKSKGPRRHIQGAFATRA
jgi:hypothetical protein